MDEDKEYKWPVFSQNISWDERVKQQDKSNQNFFDKMKRVYGIEPTEISYLGYTPK